MAKRTVRWMIDDLTGEDLDDGVTVQFGLDGFSYELDLSPSNAAALRSELAVYVAGARRAGRSSSERAAAGPTPVDSRAVRAWASSNGVQVSPRGRIPASVVEQFRAAGN